MLNKLLEDGNTLYRKNRYDEAAHRYQYALRRMPDTFAGQHRPIFEQLNVHLLLNLSRCRRKNGQTKEAVELADRVLAFNPASYEAHYAKAKANKEGGRLREALACLMQAAKVAPAQQNRDLHRVILRLKEEIRAEEGKAAKEGKTVHNNNNGSLNKHDTDSTSGVDSTGSSCCNKDFENDVSSTSVHI